MKMTQFEKNMIRIKLTSVNFFYHAGIFFNQNEQLYKLFGY